MEISQETQNGVEIFNIMGRLDSNTSTILDKSLSQSLTNGSTRIIIDFEHLEYISSAGIRVILKTVKKLKQNQGNLVLCSLQDYVQEVFEIAGFDSYLTIEKDIEKALLAARLP